MVAGRRPRTLAKQELLVARRRESIHVNQSFVIAFSLPRPLLEAWITVLLTPIAWLAALGGLYSLTDATCSRPGQVPMSALALACLVIALAPAPVAWLRGRYLRVNGHTGERARFLFHTAAGLSALFALVTLLTAIPIITLAPCPS